jgi:hypothetical protein
MGIFGEKQNYETSSSVELDQHLLLLPYLSLHGGTDLNKKAVFNGCFMTWNFGLQVRKLYCMELQLYYTY